MVLPLAPANLTSRIWMPPAVCVAQARTLPARINTSPIIASVHLRCMAALPFSPVAPDRFVSGAFLFREEAYPKEKSAQAKAMAFHIAIQIKRWIGEREKFRQVECKYA